MATLRPEFTMPVGRPRPNVFKSVLFSERVLTAGEINVDCCVDSRMAKDRSDAVNDPEMNKSMLMGTNLGDNFEFVNVENREALFIVKKLQRSNGHEKFFPRKPYVFSSFNGM